MICSNCGTPNEAGRKFCGECGTRLAAVCPSCGTANSPGTRFCGECGTVLAAGTAPAAAAAIATSQPAPANGPLAERRLVTVLFADLVGFTTISEGRDPEAVRELLGRYFDTAREQIERYGGTVEKFIGDAVMAVWGAPTAHEDDAERGVRAALEVVDAVRNLGPGIQARAGVLTGEAAVTVGARGQGMVAGDLVNTASRLQSVAPPGMVLVGESTQRATSLAIAYEAAGEQLLKGKASPVPAFRALRVVAERRGKGGRDDRLEAAFVGRDTELRLLKDLYHATSRERRVRLVSITGLAGIGKSRLIWELNKYVDGIAEDLFWHDGRSPAYGQGITFWALGEMVRTRAHLSETDDTATTRAKLRETVERFVPIGPDRDRIEGALQVLLGVSDAQAGSTGELFVLWRTYFERMAQSDPVIMVFEDLHWADPGQLDFIDHMLEWSRNAPILIITLARPELLDKRPDWGAGRRNFLALDLEPLAKPDMHELLVSFVPGISETAAATIVDRAEGIPLYAVETIRMLAADGRLKERPEGGFEPVGELGDLAVPDTLHALIAARLDGLEPAERSLIQDAAVLGQSFVPAGLAAVSGLDDDELERRLRALSKADLLREETDPTSPEFGQYAFVQALIREVAYSTLSLKDRRSRHLAAARYFESLGADELAGALAGHYLAAYRATTETDEAAAVATQARISLRAAAERADSLGSPRQAVSILEQALEVAPDDRDRAAVLEGMSMAARTAADFEEAERRGRELLALARSMGDRALMARALDIVAAGLGDSRQNEAAYRVATEAIAEFGDLGDEPALAGLMVTQAMAAEATGDRTIGRELADRALAAAERLRDPELVTRILQRRGYAAFEEGHLWEALALVEGAKRLADQHGLTDRSMRISTLLANFYAVDDPRATFELEREVLELTRRLGRRGTEATVLGNMAEDARRTGDWDFMLEELEAQQQGDHGLALLIDSGRAPLIALRGELDDASAQAILERLDAFDDADVSSTAMDIRAILALTSGDAAGAAAWWIRTADVSQLNAQYALPRAGFASILAGDEATAQTCLDRLVALGARGRAIEADMTAIRAGLAALAGDREVALTGYRTARAAFHDLGVPWDEALTAMSAASTLGADTAEVAGWLADARKIMVGLKAQPLVEMIDRLSGGAASEGRASDKTAGDQVAASSSST
jgi:class 3 adenylate cyclase/tetratricopeptide (TPR) repeat protein